MLQNFGAYSNAKNYATGSNGGGFTTDYSKYASLLGGGNGNRSGSSVRTVN